MPTLGEWPAILASAAEAVLSVPELGYVMPVHSSPPAGFSALPCIIIEPGDAGVWVEPSSSGPMSTLCQMTARYTVRLAVGDPGTPGAMDITADAVQRLYAGLSKAVAADPDSGGFAPPVGDVLTPSAEEYAAIGIWSARLPVTVPVSKITTAGSVPADVLLTTAGQPLQTTAGLQLSAA